MDDIYFLDLDVFFLASSSMGIWKKSCLAYAAAAAAA
jgi:hypothetical protein